jgi:hypothetical protein
MRNLQLKSDIDLFLLIKKGMGQCLIRFMSATGKNYTFIFLGEPGHAKPVLGMMLLSSRYYLTAIRNTRAGLDESRNSA